LIKRIRPINTDPKTKLLLSRDDFRGYVESWESELLRGISTLAVLVVIDSGDSEQMYGYNILNELKRRTNNMLILEEGNLYPTLRKLKQAAILETKDTYDGKRKRICYYLTPYGQQVLQHMSGAFSKLVESMSDMFKIDVNLQTEKYIYCPNCTMRYSAEEIGEDQLYCSACGFHIRDQIDRVFGGN
jgi:PadR family transcriptional regulator PadR